MQFLLLRVYPYRIVIVTHNVIRAVFLLIRSTFYGITMLLVPPHTLMEGMKDAMIDDRMDEIKASSQ
jgi:hypothetical protein